MPKTIPPSAMTRRGLLAVAGALFLSPRLGPAWAALPGGEVVARVEAYLNALDSLEARFVQRNPNGSTDRGRLYYRRPDQMRFDYDRPSRVLIVARQGTLTYWDPAMNQLTRVDVEETPLGILLRETVDLDQTVQVADVEERPGELVVRVLPRGGAGHGSLTLVFGDRPLALKAWTVVDPQGLSTTVTLRDVQTGGVLNPDLFRFRDPRLFGAGANEVN